jgi:hypothetical protein
MHTGRMCACNCEGVITHPIGHARFTCGGVQEAFARSATTADSYRGAEMRSRRKPCSFWYVTKRRERKEVTGKHTENRDTRREQRRPSNTGRHRTQQRRKKPCRNINQAEERKATTTHGTIQNKQGPQRPPAQKLNSHPRQWHKIAKQAGHRQGRR